MIGTKVIQIFERTKQFSNIFINMEKKSPWKQYVIQTKADNELIETYRELRHSFKREGWSEKDLESISSFPTDIFLGWRKFNNLRDKLYFELKSFFGVIDEDEFNNYIRNRLKLIDIETPLKNGNIKRNNPRDEDN